MKKWMGLGITLLIILLCSYYGMGIGTEKALKKNIELLNQSGEMVLTLEHYQRGWFHSHADLKWTLKVSQSPSDRMVRRTVLPMTKSYVFEVPVDIAHGPIMWANKKVYFGLGYASTHVRLPKEYEQKLAEKYQFQANKLEYRMNIFINYLNQSTIQIGIPQNIIRAKNSSDFVEWMGMISNMVVSSDKQTLQGNFAFKGITWKNDDFKGMLGPVAANYDMHEVLNHLYAGTAELKLSSLVLFKLENVIMRMTDAQIKSESVVKNGLFNSSVETKLSQLTIGNRTYPNNSFALAVKNLDASVLATMNQKLTNIQQSDADKQKILWTLLPDLPALLSKGAQLKIDNFAINSNNGHIKGTLSLALPNQNLTNPLQLLQTIEGESQIYVTREVFSKWLNSLLFNLIHAKQQQQTLNQELQASSSHQAAKQEKTAAVAASLPKAEDIAALAKAKTNLKIQEWVNAKILITEGKDYLIALKLMNGKLFINGQVFNPTMLTI